MSESKLFDQFTIIKELDGNPGEKRKFHIYLATPECDQPILLALKEIDSKRAVIYRSLCGKWHPNLASIYEVRKLEEEEKSLAVMEFVKGVSLSEYVFENGTLKENEALAYAHQIAEGLSYLHSLELLHKDIKPDNIILTPPDQKGRRCAKIIDYGISEIYDPRKTYATEYGGTRGYCAPEVNDYVASKKSDIYSLGCVLNFMLCGVEPSFERYSGNPEIEKILDRACALDASFRYANIGEFMRALEHAGRYRPGDRIPLLRNIPGFRSHKPLNMLSASAFYSCMAFSLTGCVKAGDYTSALIFTLFYILLPCFFVFDITNWSVRLLKHLRINRLYLWQMKLLTMFLCLLLPLVLGFSFPPFEIIKELIH